MKSSVLIFTFGSLAIFVPSILARSLRLQKRAAFYIANETACIVDSIVYYNGDPIPTDDPCEACKCRPPGFACVLRECEVKPGCRAVRKAGHCCPEYVCGCEHNGRMYRDGDEIRDSQNPCYTCHCQGSAIACAFVDCFFRVDCAPDYVPGECCPRYDHCSPLASTVNESSSKEFSTTPSPGTSPAPTEAKTPETTIKVEVFTELSLFGLPDLGFNSVIGSTDTKLQASNPESPNDSNLQIGTENTKDESPSIATTLESIPSTTAKTESQHDSTAPVFYLPKENGEPTEKETEDKESEADNSEQLETTSPDAISDNLPNADEVVTSDAESSSKPALYIHGDNSEQSERLTTLSVESSDDESSSVVYDNKQDTPVKDAHVPEEKISTLSSDLTTISIVSDKIATTSIPATPIPVLLLNAKVSITNKEEKKKTDEDIILSETTGKPAISTDVIEEVAVVSELAPEEVTDQKTHDSTVDASSAIPLETTTNVIDVSTSKSNRIGKQNEDQSKITTTETAGQTTTNNNDIETTTEMLVLSTTLNTEAFDTDGTTLEESKDELSLVYAKGGDKSKPILNATENSATISESTTTESKVPAEIAETKASAETTEAKASAETTEAKASAGTTEAKASAETTEAKASEEITETKASTEIIKSTEPVDDQTTPESALTAMTTESLPLKTETDLTKESETKTTVEEIDLTSEK